MKELGIKNLICHQGFLNAFTSEYRQDDSSVDPKELKDFDCVLSGHYHRSQTVGENIRYFGSPFTCSFGEAGETKFIWIIREEKGLIQSSPILTRGRRHYQFDITNLSQLQKREDIKAEDFVKVNFSGTKEEISKVKIEDL